MSNSPFYIINNVFVFLNFGMFDIFNDTGIICNKAGMKDRVKNNEV
jgi:hypothetical protein